MKHLSAIHSIAFCALISLSPHSIAATITVTGTITDSLDHTGSAFGFGSGYGTLTGKVVSQKFTFESTAPIYDLLLGTDPDRALYGTPFAAASQFGSWITVRTFIDGIELKEPIETFDPSLYGNIDSLTIQNGYDPVNSRFSSDVVQVTQSSIQVFRDDSRTTYTSSSSQLVLLTVSDFISNLSPNQNFHFDINKEYIDGGGQVSRSIVENTDSGTNYPVGGYFNYAIQTVQYDAEIPPVPEPKTILLILIGLTGMALTRAIKKDNSFSA